MARRPVEEYQKYYEWDPESVIVWRNGVAIDLNTGKPLDPQPTDEQPLPLTDEEQ